MVNYQEVGSCFTASDPAELQPLAPQIIARAGDHTIWLFEGPLGAGKTTLIQAICKAKGVVDVVSSPTFALVNEYCNERDETFYHFDFFRIREEAEAYDIGCHEYFESGNICFIEWGSKIPSLVPDKHLKITIQVEENGNRKIVIERND